jgi:ribonuclease P protein component
LLTKIGFPVGKNFSKKAVERNRARRILRAACQQYLAQLKPGFNLVVMIRPGYQDITFKKVSAELNQVFKKANLLM